MTGAALVPALPCGSATAGLPAPRWRRRLRLLLVLGGLAFAFWLAGLLLGSSHARAAETGSAPSLDTAKLTAQLNATTRDTTAAVQHVQDTATATVAPRPLQLVEQTRQVVRQTVATTRHAVAATQQALTTVQTRLAHDVHQVTGTVSRTVRQVSAPVTRPASPTPTGVAVPTMHGPASRHQPVGAAHARPLAHPTAHHALAARTEARTVVVDHAVTTRPVTALAAAFPADSPNRPRTPARPTSPAPVAPTAPSTGDAHDLAAALIPDRALLPRPASTPAAADDTVADDVFSYDPSFSPD